MQYSVTNVYDVVSTHNVQLSRRMIVTPDKVEYIALTTNLLADFGSRFLLRNLISISDNSFSRSIKIANPRDAWNRFVLIVRTHRFHHAHAVYQIFYGLCNSCILTENLLQRFLNLQIYVSLFIIQDIVHWKIIYYDRKKRCQYLFRNADKIFFY